jgi:hypothetical protein
MFPAEEITCRGLNSCYSPGIQGADEITPPGEKNVLCEKGDEITRFDGTPTIQYVKQG